MYKKGDLHIHYTQKGISRSVPSQVYLWSNSHHSLELYPIGNKKHVKQLIEDLQHLLEGLSED